jgi:hypothetical protein
MEIRNMVDGKIVSINGKPVVETPKPIVVEEPKKKVVKPTPTPTPNDEIDHFNNVDVIEPIQDEEPT